MKKIVSWIALAAVAAALVFLIVLPALQLTQEEESGITFDAEPLKLSEEDLKSIGCRDEDMQQVAAQGDLVLYMNMLSGEFRVENTAQGTVWYSNPVGWNDDAIARPSTENSDILGSQVVVECYDKSNRRQVLDSYSDCFRKGQLYITEQDNGVRVDYLIGTLKLPEYCPRIVRAEIFDQVMAQLNEDDAFTLDLRYQRITKKTSEDTRDKLRDTYENIDQFEEFYVIRATTGTVAKKEIAQQFALIGWTEEDTVAEHERFGYKPEQNDAGCFLVPVEYRLENGTFVAEILSEQIQIQKGFYLSNIDLLPSFAAGTAQDQGYMLLPDGSGALVKLNGTTQHGYTYQQPIYGRNHALTQQLSNQTLSQVYLPIFGISTQKGSMLAVVESAEADGTVKATLAGEISTCNLVHSAFSPMVKDYMSYDNLMNVEGTYVFTKQANKQRYTVRYLFMGAGSGYSEMAAAYRGYLIGRGVLKQQAAPIGLYLDLVGAVDKRETFLGIPYTTHAPLTTFAQAQTILQQLQQNGLQNITVRYSGWANNGLNNSLYDGADPLSVLGGSDGLEQLLQFAGQNGIGLHMDAELALMRSTGLFDGFSADSDGVRSITRKVATMRGTRKSTGELLDRIWYLIGADKQADTLQEFLEEYSEYGNRGLSLASLGQMLYGDYRTDGLLHRTAFAAKLQQMLEQQVRGKYDVLFDGANANVLAYAAGLLNVPTSSSGLLLADRSVPFYQMVVSGCLPYAGAPINLSGDWRTELLDAAQTGASLHYQWMFAENSTLYDTEYTDLFALHYSTWLEDTAAAVARYQRDMQPVAGRQILQHHMVQPNVYRTVFEGGYSVLVNYGSSAVTCEYGEIGAKAYVVKEAE